MKENIRLHMTIGEIQAEEFQERLAAPLFKADLPVRAASLLLGLSAMDPIEEIDY